MKIIEVTLRTADSAAQARFYGETLGLPVTAERDGTVTIQIGRSRLRFEPQAGFSGRYHFAFNITEPLIDAAADWLIGRGVSLLKDAEGRNRFRFDGVWHADAFYFRDAGGNIVELIARHALSHSPAEAFSPDHILSISEIGIATTDVRAAVAELTAKFETEIFSSPDSDTFTAVGSHESLFIVVSQGRIWYPNTGDEAVMLPLRVTAETNGGHQKTLTETDVPHTIK